MEKFIYKVEKREGQQFDHGYINEDEVSGFEIKRDSETDMLDLSTFESFYSTIHDMPNEYEPDVYYPGGRMSNGAKVYARHKIKDYSITAYGNFINWLEESKDYYDEETAEFKFEEIDELIEEIKTYTFETFAA